MNDGELQGRMLDSSENENAQMASQCHVSYSKRMLDRHLGIEQVKFSLMFVTKKTFTAACCIWLPIQYRPIVNQAHKS